RGSTQFWLCSLLETIRNNAINAPPIPATREVKVRFDFGRYRCGMLDHLTIHVEDVKWSGGRIAEWNWPAPLVCSRDKFVPLVHTLAGQRDACGLEHFPMDEVASHIGDKCQTPKFRRKGITTINRDACGACEISRRPAAAFECAARL